MNAIWTLARPNSLCAENVPDRQKTGESFRAGAETPCVRNGCDWGTAHVTGSHKVDYCNDRVLVVRDEN